MTCPTCENKHASERYCGSCGWRGDRSSDSQKMADIAVASEYLRVLERPDLKAFLNSGEAVAAASELESAKESAKAEIAAWEDTAAQSQRNAEYYKDLVVQIGENFGDAAKTADDGTLGDSILCAKVPELVHAFMNQKPEPPPMLPPTDETAPDPDEGQK